MSQGKMLTDAHLLDVARVYAKAYESRVWVQQAVAEHFGVAVSTASKQIMQARRRGFLLSEEQMSLMREYAKAKENLINLERQVAIASSKA